MTDDIQRHAIMLEALTTVLDKRLADYRASPDYYSKGNVITDLHRRNLAKEIRGLRKAIATTRRAMVAGRVAA